MGAFLCVSDDSKDVRDSYNSKRMRRQRIRTRRNSLKFQDHQTPIFNIDKAHKSVNIMEEFEFNMYLTDDESEYEVNAEQPKKGFYIDKNNEKYEVIGSARNKTRLKDRLLIVYQKVSKSSSPMYVCCSNYFCGKVKCDDGSIIKRFRFVSENNENSESSGREDNSQIS